MRHITLTLSLPWSPRPYTTSAYGRSVDEIQRAIQRATERYARRWGVSPMAVEQDVAWSVAR